MSRNVKSTISRFRNNLSIRLLKNPEHNVLIKLGVCFLISIIITEFFLGSSWWLGKVIVAVISAGFFWSYLSTVWTESGGSVSIGNKKYAYMAALFIIAFGVGSVLCLTVMLFILASHIKEPVHGRE